jgi:hypothetical protein
MCGAAARPWLGPDWANLGAPRACLEPGVWGRAGVWGYRVAIGAASVSTTGELRATLLKSLRSGWSPGACKFRADRGQRGRRVIGTWVGTLGVAYGSLCNVVVSKVMRKLRPRGT